MSLLVPLMLLPVRLWGEKRGRVSPERGVGGGRAAPRPNAHLWPMVSGMGMISGASKNSLSSSSSLKSPFAGQHGSGEWRGKLRQRVEDSSRYSPAGHWRVPRHHQPGEGPHTTPAALSGGRQGLGGAGTGFVGGGAVSSCCRCRSRSAAQERPDRAIAWGQQCEGH